MRNIDCIYYGGIDKDTKMHICKHNRSLFMENEKMCEHCKLYDSYIPNTATESQIERAKKWDKIPFEEQPNYKEYFNL